MRTLSGSFMICRQQWSRRGPIAEQDIGGSGQEVGAVAEPEIKFTTATVCFHVFQCFFIAPSILLILAFAAITSPIDYLCTIVQYVICDIIMVEIICRFK